VVVDLQIKLSGPIVSVIAFLSSAKLIVPFTYIGDDRSISFV